MVVCGVFFVSALTVGLFCRRIYNLSSPQEGIRTHNWNFFWHFMYRTYTNLKRVSCHSSIATIVLDQNTGTVSQHDINFKYWFSCCHAKPLCNVLFPREGMVLMQQALLYTYQPTHPAHQEMVISSQLPAWGRINLHSHPFLPFLLPSPPSWAPLPGTFLQLNSLLAPWWIKSAEKYSWVSFLKD